MNQPRAIREHIQTRRMLPKLERLYQSMELQKTMMLTHLESLSDEERNSAPGPSEWSPLQVLEHSISVEEIAGEVLPEAAQVLMKGRLFILFGGGFMRLSARSGLRMPTLPVFEPVGDLDFTAMKHRWTQSREALALKLTTVTQNSLRLPFVMHPVAGPLNAKQFLELLDVHLAYHWRHFPRVKT